VNEVGYIVGDFTA